MNKNLPFQILSALFLIVAMPLGVTAQTTFFSDSFSGGSTLNSTTPANPTLTSTAYEMISSKAWTPNPPTIAANDLKFGITATSSGYVEAEALFATNVIALVQPGDYIQLTVVFTNTSGLLTAAGQLGFGLYNSGQVKPVPGGINNTIANAYTGNAQTWQGYAAAVNFTGSASRILSRPTQAGTTGLNQDLVTFGTSSSFAGSAVVGTATGDATLTVGSTYTEVFMITLNTANSLAITNILYSGPNTSGTVITNFGGVATNATFLTGGFDALAVGYCGRSTAGGNPLIDISSVKVDGSVTTISGPPAINQQPLPVSVATNGAGAFSVTAAGFSMTYQWHRNGTNLLNGGNISGATSSTLVIASAGTADAASGANGYYVTVTGAGNFSTNSVTNSLVLIPATNLVYSGSGPWDLNTSPSWQDTNGNVGLYFNFGDPVTFDDVGGGGIVNLTGTFLSAASVTVNHTSSFYTFQGTGSFAGPGNLLYEGSGQFTINNANTYSGGTIISNANANLRLQNLNGLGLGPVTFAKAGGKMEIIPTGSATLGINGDVNVADDFSIQVDGVGSFAVVLLGNLNGASGKTLTFNPLDLSTTNRFRVYGTNSLCNANIVLNGPSTSQALFSGTVLAPYGASGSQNYNGIISGNGGFVQRGSGNSILSGQNTYSGGTFITAGGIALGVDSIPTTGAVASSPIGTGPLFVSPESGSANGSGTVLAANGARTIANPIQYPTATNNQTLIIGGTNAMTFTGSYALNGQDGSATAVNRTIQVNNTNSLATLSGVISDGGFGCGLIKTGTGILALNNAETYTGPTTNSAGTLQINGSLAALSAITVSSNAILAGTGTINGTVTVNPAGILAPGTAAIGVLNINNNLTMAGNALFKVNKSVSPSNDVAVVSGTLINTGTGTLTVTNLGSALVVGDTFKLFNKAVANGSALIVTGGGLVWANNLQIDGSISVLSTSASKPVINSVLLQSSGTQFVLNGTNGTLNSGYSVLSSTNVATPLTNWVLEASGTFNGSGAFSYTNTIAPGTPHKFLLLRVP